MDVGLTSVAATTQVINYALMARLWGVKDPNLEELLGVTSGDAADSHEPVTARRRAQLGKAAGSTGGSAAPTADSVRMQQLVAGVSIEQTRFSMARVEITEDAITVEWAEFERTRVFAFAAASGEVKETDPLLLDLDGDGFETTGVGGAAFDLDGDGRLDSASLATGGDALLAMDRNGNGTIDDGTELFGDHHGAADGIAELAGLDDNGDGRVDAADTAFSALRLFTAQGTRSLTEAGIVSLDLVRQAYLGTATGGDRLVDTIGFTFADGREGLAADALLQHV